VSAPAAVEAVVTAGGSHLRPLLTRVEERLADVAAGHGPRLGDFAAATIAAGGKRLRPLLVLLAAGEPADDGEDLVRAAASVELVHSATLIHDDVLDRSALRRGRPTVWATGGRSVAIAAGDLLFSRAFAELALTGSLEAVRALSRASSALAQGELLQREDAWTAIGVERYLRRCELKTAELFAAACELGALHRGGLGSGLAAFGRRVGLAFQVLDDVLDVSGPPERTGKPRGTDMLDGTVTLPLILARAHHPALRELDLRSVRDAAQAAAVCDAIEVAGALDEARAHALRLVDEAKEALVPLDLEAAQRRALLLVADSVVDRSS
jgi:geranylgeranyl pyrophosphate synthase